MKKKTFIKLKIKKDESMCGVAWILLKVILAFKLAPVWKYVDNWKDMNVHGRKEFDKSY